MSPTRQNTGWERNEVLALLQLLTTIILWAFERLFDHIYHFNQFHQEQPPAESGRIINNHMTGGFGTTGANDLTHPQAVQSTAKISDSVAPATMIELRNMPNKQILVREPAQRRLSV